MYFSPLEQFKVLPLFFFGFSKVFILTNVNFFLFIISIFIILFIYLSLKDTLLISNRFYGFIELFYVFAYGCAFESLGKVCNNFFPYLILIFLIVLSSNVFGLIPYSFTLTSQFVITFFLGFRPRFFGGIV